MDEEVRQEITLDEVAANVLLDFNGMRPKDEGYELAMKASDMVLRHVDESNKQDIELERIKQESERAKDQLEFEKEKHKAELEQLKRQNDLKEFEIKVAKWTATCTAGVGVLAIGRDVWEFVKSIEFEQTGVFRSLVSKIATSRINKR